MKYFLLSVYFTYVSELLQMYKNMLCIKKMQELFRTKTKSLLKHREMLEKMHLLSIKFC